MGAYGEKSWLMSEKTTPSHTIGNMPALKDASTQENPKRPTIDFYGGNVKMREKDIRIANSKV